MSNFGQSGPTASGGRPVSQVQPTSQPTQSQPNKRLQDTQSQVNEVVDIMKANVDKVLERDQNLSELNYRADSLHDGARQFENTATRLKRKYWWQNCKMWLILIAVLVVIIIIIIVAIVTSVPKSGGSSDPPATPKAPSGR